MEWVRWRCVRIYRADTILHKILCTIYTPDRTSARVFSAGPPGLFVRSTRPLSGPFPGMHGMVACSCVRHRLIPWNTPHYVEHASFRDTRLIPWNTPPFVEHASFRCKRQRCAHIYMKEVLHRHIYTYTPLTMPPLPPPHTTSLITRPWNGGPDAVSLPARERAKLHGDFPLLP